MPQRTAHPNAIARFDLTGQVAWVAGGAGLLGTQVCTALAEHGTHVVIADSRADPAERLAAALRTDGLAAESACLDVGDGAAVDAQAARILADHGRLDVCVNLSAFHSGMSYQDITEQGLAAGFRVSLIGAFQLGRAAGRAMREPRPDGSRGGRIVQFSSMYGVVSPDPSNYPDGLPINPVDYGMAKAGILQLVRYQAVQLAPFGIGVNAIVPGPFPNPDGQGANDGFVRQLSSRVPMGRVGSAPEISGAVLFLCSPAASFVTGTSITVDGGWTAW